MCYGDIDHGTDGYYREWAEHQERLEQERHHEHSGEECVEKEESTSEVCDG